MIKRWIEHKKKKKKTWQTHEKGFMLNILFFLLLLENANNRICPFAWKITFYENCLKKRIQKEMNEEDLIDEKIIFILVKITKRNMKIWNGSKFL